MMGNPMDNRMVRFLVNSCVAVATTTLCLSGSPAGASNCAVTTVGRTPLNDLGPGTYQGMQGGLYPGGANERPPAHDNAGQAIAAAVTPINGRIVLISIGMSNTTQEFSRFVPLAMNYPGRNPALRVVDCAQGGQTAPIVANPNSPYWNTVRQRLQQAGVDSTQVRAVWLKEAMAHPTLAFPADATELQGYLRAIAMLLEDKFPNLDLVYLSSRIYAGYATGVSQLNPEPYAYQSGFSVKWVIEAQIGGLDPGLNYDPQAGPVEAPWLSWGPYLWADGLVPRSDGLIWECADFQTDGTHPSESGRAKVAAQLLEFFTSDVTTTPWFLAPATGVPALDLAPGALALGPAAPNPMRSGTSLPLLVGGGAETRIAIYAVNGRLVRLLESGSLAPGRHVIGWDGRDGDGRAVASGAYFVRAEATGAPPARLKLIVER
jgi:hypothetical protein